MCFTGLIPSPAHNSAPQEPSFILRTFKWQTNFPNIERHYQPPASSTLTQASMPLSYLSSQAYSFIGLHVDAFDIWGVSSGVASFARCELDKEMKE